MHDVHDDNDDAVFEYYSFKFALILHRYVLPKKDNSGNISTTTQWHENSSTSWKISLRIFLVESHEMQLLSK